MRLYLDQMLRVDLAAALRAEGHDVLQASEAGQARADDAEVLALAIRESRILITLDEHFGDWCVLPLSNHPGVVRLKIHPPLSAAIAGRLIPFLRAHEASALRGCLVIVDARRERWIRTVRD